jgi:hypothetical protein
MGWQPARLLHSIQPDVGYPFRICLILKAINMNTFSDEQLKQYHQDGYYLLKNLFDKEEIELLHKSATADRTLDKPSWKQYLWDVCPLRTYGKQGSTNPR